MTSHSSQTIAGRYAAACAAMMLFGATQARAADSSFLPDGISGTLVLATDYVDAGFSQTAGHVAVQGGLQWTHASGFYAGVWASNVDFGSDDPVVAQIEPSVGITGSFGTTGYDVAATYKFYPRKRAPAAASIQREKAAEAPADFPSDASIPVNPDLVTDDYEFLELTSELTRDSVLGTWSLSTAYSPDMPGAGGHAVAVALGLATPVTDKFTVSAAVQKSWVPAIAGPDYADWNAGITYALDFADIDLRYHQAEDKACDGGCSARFVFSLIKEF